LMMPSSWHLLRRQTKNRRRIEDGFLAPLLGGGVAAPGGASPP
jgi:hypothetical protein